MMTHLPVSFRLTTIFYVMALLAAALTVFGAWGIVLSVCIVGFWLAVWHSTQKLDVVMSCAVAAMFLLVLVLSIPALNSGVRTGRRPPCLTNLRDIAIALQNYEVTYGSFPPAMVADADGKPMHSWRVLLLPFVGEQKLYDEYKLDEPWNSRHNQRLATRMPAIYRCPESRPVPSDNCADYFAVVGEAAAWHPDRPRAITEFVDGLSQTIQVLESSTQDINWLEPRDLSMEEAMEQLTTAQFTGHQGWSQHWLCDEYRTYSGRYMSRPDGHAEYTGQFADPAQAEALLTLDAGDFVDSNAKTTNNVKHEYRTRYDNLFYLGPADLVTSSSFGRPF